MLEDTREEIDNFIGYAVKEGYLDADDVKEWTWKQKYEYIRMAEIAENARVGEE